MRLIHSLYNFPPAASFNRNLVEVNQVTDLQNVLLLLKYPTAATLNLLDPEDVYVPDERTQAEIVIDHSIGKIVEARPLDLLGHFYALQGLLTGIKFQ
jgi:hypothetical protein